MLRPEGLTRLSDFNVGSSHPYFLHYRTLNKALAHVSHYARGCLLDIGCGNKPYRRMFPGVTNYIGCDIVQSSQRCVEIICDSTQIPLHTGSCDTVLCTQVLEHVANYEEVLMEAYRVLRTDGTLIVSVPMYWPLHEEPYDFFRFTRYGLEYALQRAGLEVIEILANGGKWALLGQGLLHAIEPSQFNHENIIESVNRVFSWLDDYHFSDKNTMNYVAIAKRP